MNIEPLNTVCYMGLYFLYIILSKIRTLDYENTKLQEKSKQKIRYESSLLLFTDTLVLQGSGTSALYTTFCILCYFRCLGKKLFCKTMLLWSVKAYSDYMKNPMKKLGFKILNWICLLVRAVYAGGFVHLKSEKVLESQAMIVFWHIGLLEA